MNGGKLGKAECTIKYERVVFLIKEGPTCPEGLEVSQGAHLILPIDWKQHCPHHVIISLLLPCSEAMAKWQSEEHCLYS